MGHTAEQMGARGAGNPFQSGWQYQTSIDPEELFRKIFGDFKRAGGMDFGGQDFAESAFGFGAAQEVSVKFLSPILIGYILVLLANVSRCFIFCFFL